MRSTLDDGGWNAQRITTDTIINYPMWKTLSVRRTHTHDSTQVSAEFGVTNTTVHRKMNTFRHHNFPEQEKAGRESQYTLARTKKGYKQRCDKNVLVYLCTTYMYEHRAPFDCIYIFPLIHYTSITLKWRDWKYAIAFLLKETTAHCFGFDSLISPLCSNAQLTSFILLVYRHRWHFRWAINRCRWRGMRVH